MPYIEAKTPVGKTVMSLLFTGTALVGLFAALNGNGGAWFVFLAFGGCTIYTLRNTLAHRFLAETGLWPAKFLFTSVGTLVVGFLMAACGASGNNPSEPTPALRIGLSEHGLPRDFFQADADTKCAHQIIGYRFVVWLNNETVAVGFNTSPNCRLSSNQKVNGMARILVFNTQGRLKASRDIPYEADGGIVLVAPGEVKAGPVGTLVFRFDEEDFSKSGLLLLDANLKEVIRLDRFLEQTTFVDHALVFQEGVVWTGPRTYDTFDGLPPIQTRKKEELWPVGTMDRKFGEHGVAYMLCQQELRPNEWVSDNVVYANARRRCRMVSEADGQATWEVPLKDEGTAVIVGILANGSVVGQVPAKGRKDRQLVIWTKDGQTQTLPWIAPKYCGAVDSATTDMSRYATFAAEDCDSDVGRWIVFDRTSQTPITDRLFPRNGRAALSPDGLRYASFEAGELRIYTLPSPPGAANQTNTEQHCAERGVSSPPCSAQNAGPNTDPVSPTVPIVKAL